MEAKKLCSIGLIDNSDKCSVNEFVKISELSSEDQELLRFRSTVIITGDSTICESHQIKLLKLFVLHQRRCCDPFRKHKKAITSKNYLCARCSSKQ